MTDTDTDTDALFAAPRDASVWARPNTRSPKRVHVAVNVQRSPWSDGEAFAEAACDPGRTPLDMSLSAPAEETPVPVRCRRQGCAALWRALEARRG